MQLKDPMNYLHSDAAWRSVIQSRAFESMMSPHREVQRTSMLRNLIAFDEKNGRLMKYWRKRRIELPSYNQAVMFSRYPFFRRPSVG